MWLGKYVNFSELPILQSRHANYSEQDLGNFQGRLETLHSAPSQNEWEGRYAPGGTDMVGISLLDISFKTGFASLYIYTCTPELRSIDYGKVVDKPDTIELVSVVPEGSPRKSRNVVFVKVKWGKHLYLVSEKSLAVWAEKAVGRYVPTEDDYEQSWADYWETGDIEAPYSGWPLLPSSFRHLERRPIEAKIFAVAPRMIETDFSSGLSFHSGESAVYRVRFNAGSSSGVRKGMTFEIKGTSEQLTVTKVGKSKSEGVIVRVIDDARRDHCTTDAAQLIKCPAIIPGVAISTVAGRFSF